MESDPLDGDETYILESVQSQLGVASWGDTATERGGDGDDDNDEDGDVTGNDVHDSDHVDCPITPATGSVKLLIEARLPDAEHPTVTAHEPRQQKPAQQKLREPAHIGHHVYI